jgi:uncharacterized protein
MNQNFLSGANQGKNGWWRYLIGIFTTQAFSIIFGIIAAILIFLYFERNSLFFQPFSERVFEEKFKSFSEDSSSFGGYLATNIFFVFEILALWLAVTLLHRRKFSTLIRVNLPIRWQRILASALVWNCILWVWMGIDYLIHPKNYVWGFNSDWWWMLPIVLILTPIQTSCEELFFRGYLMQGMALLTRNRLVLIFLNGIIFLLPHLGNPEMQRGWITGSFYFIFGAVLAAMTIYDNGLELALGIHAANNLQVVFANHKDSALPFPSIWQIQTPNPPLLDVVLTIVSFAVFYYVFFGRQKNRALSADVNNLD